MKKIFSEISAGELLDKISILEIKLKKIKNKNKKKEIKKELNILKNIKDKSINTKKLNKFYRDLKKNNLVIWNLINRYRGCFKKSNFKKEFLDLSKKIYLKNEKRFHIKSSINNLLNSNIKEVKQQTIIN